MLFNLITTATTVNQCAGAVAEYAVVRWHQRSLYGPQSLLSFAQYLVRDARVVWVLPQHDLADVDGLDELLALQVAEGELEAHRCRRLELQLEGLK